MVAMYSRVEHELMTCRVKSCGETWREGKRDHIQNAMTPVNATITNAGQKDRDENDETELARRVAMLALITYESRGKRQRRQRAMCEVVWFVSLRCPKVQSNNRTDRKNTWMPRPMNSWVV